MSGIRLSMRVWDLPVRLLHWSIVVLLAPARTPRPIIDKLNNEAAGCASQIAQLPGQSKLSATATGAELKKGKDEFHASIKPFDDEIKADEDELDHLKVITTETEQTFLVRINEVQVIALGENGQGGTLITVCQTIIVEITQVIVIVQPAPSGGDEDIKTAA